MVLCGTTLWSYFAVTSHGIFLAAFARTQIWPCPNYFRHHDYVYRTKLCSVQIGGLKPAPYSLATTTSSEFRWCCGIREPCCSRQPHQLVGVTMDENVRGRWRQSTASVPRTVKTATELARSEQHPERGPFAQLSQEALEVRTAVTGLRGSP